MTCNVCNVYNVCNVCNVSRNENDLALEDVLLQVRNVGQVVDVQEDLRWRARVVGARSSHRAI